ncbi:glutathione S-transferase GST-6.0 [Candidatus Phycosocius bacilliformis]|uniref:Glutathione S-transferase GST-6.0 n=1 Tax=Candidatus Phycosocius bacilliformis TaxID=1445552 RepID=A0A2P2E9X4_9PROT|nr:glutathione S-transferase family protein [Candidatus Phycosocius bacilliformis]GBF57844.1 glutathione S-transferase GST-6.0 [Candidatus Phycosocius bacilliformis]
MALPVLTIGNKNYSSWSMRPWLALSWAGIDFEERIVPLGPRGLGPNPDILAVSPSGTVPVLELEDGLRIWDSLSICEWAHERVPDAGLWPHDAGLRAQARSAVCEMHAGFAALRQGLPMNLKRVKTGHVWSEAVQFQVARIDALLCGLMDASGQPGGAYVLGQRSIVDAFYAPVATRFRTYQVPVSSRLQAWCETIFADPDFAAWDQAARMESWTIEETDIA